MKKNLSTTDPFLQERLRQVYVTSQGVTTLQVAIANLGFSAEQPVSYMLVMQVM